MSLPQKIIELTTFDPILNLKMEQFYLEAGIPIILLWRSLPAVIIGRHQIRENEIDEAAIASHHIRVVRRITGGGAIYMDLGNLNIGIISPTKVPRMPQWTVLFARILDQLGVAAESKRNDILVDGRKVSGWAETLLTGFSLAHGTLMFDVDLDMLSSVLLPPPEKLAGHGITSIRQRVANLKKYFPGWGMPEFISAIRTQLHIRP